MMLTVRRLRKSVLALLFVFAGCNSGSKPVWQWPLEGRSYAEPVVDGRTVYVVSQAGEVIAGSYETGKKAWKKKLNGAILAAPAISTKAVFVATDQGDVYALDKNTGNEIWKRHLADRFMAPVTAAQDLILVPSETGTLYALSQASGTTRWSLAGYRKFNSRALVKDPYIFIGGWNGKFLCLTMDGSINWEFKAAHAISEDAVVDDRNTVYFPAYDGFLYALDVPSGKMRWHSPVKLPTNLVLLNRELILGSEDQLLVFSPESGSLLRKIFVKKPVSRLYAWANECLVVSGSVYSIDPISGRSSVLVRSQEPIFKMAFAPAMFIVTDELYSIFGFRQ